MRKYCCGQKELEILTRHLREESARENRSHGEKKGRGLSQKGANN